MRELDQSKHRLDEIFEKQKANYSVKKLLAEFHEKLITSLEEKNCMVTSRTHKYGITYFCGNNKRKAFLFMNIRPEFLSTKFYTGDKSIYGIGKGIWLHKKDNKGSVPFPIHTELDMKKAIIYSLDAYKIASPM